MAYTDAQATNNSTRSNNLYTDLNLNFAKNPATKDVTRLKDVEAVKRSVRNLILTNRFERPFHPEIGANVRALLFENMTPVTEQLLTERIADTLRVYEPRAVLNDVVVSGSLDTNTYTATIKFYVREVPELIIVQEFLKRLR
jgi:phage baseplate assembly protein W